MSDIFEYISELRKIELEIEDQNGENITLRSYIKSVMDDKILIDAPTKKNLTYNIPDGKQIDLIIQGESGVYSGSSSVISKQITGISGIWITFPLNSKHVQRREYLRAELDLDITLNIIKSSSSDEKESMNLKLKNINGKGFSFTSGKPISSYYDLFCSFKLNDGNDKIVQSRCEHIYSDVKIVLGEMLYTHALAFIDLDESSVERIVKECFKFQLEERRNKFN